MRKSLFLCLFVIGFSFACAAQQANDLALVMGAKFSPSASSTQGTTTINNSFALEASFAHQIKGFSLANLQIEFTVMAAPNATLTSSNFFAAHSYNSLYITPGLRLRFASNTPIIPWVVAGGGMVRFSPSKVSQVGGTTPADGALKGAFDAGGGLDFKPFHFPLTFRVEAREFYSGSPNLNLPNLSLHNNLFAGAGILIRF